MKKDDLTVTVALCAAVGVVSSVLELLLDPAGSWIVLLLRR